MATITVNPAEDGTWIEFLTGTGHSAALRVEDLDLPPVAKRALAAWSAELRKDGKMNPAPTTTRR